MMAAFVALLFVQQGFMGVPTVRADHSEFHYRPEAITGATPVGGGSIKSVSACGGDTDEGTVVLSSGEFVARYTILNLPADRGFDFEVALVHRSRSEFATNPVLGHRWDFSLGQRLEFDGALSRWNKFSGDGRRDWFTWDPGQATWLSPPGFYEKLLAPPPGAPVLSLQILTANGWLVDFDPALGKIRSVTDKDGNVQSWFYTPGGFLDKVVDTHGRKTTFSYSSGRLQTITDPIGRKVQLDYNGAGQMVRFWMPGPGTGLPEIPTLFTYDGSNRVLSVTDPLNQVYISNVYDLDGRVLGQTYGRGAFTFSYDVFNRITTVTDRNGNNVRWEFSTTAPVPIRKTEFTNRGISPFNAASYVTTYQHNSNLELTQVNYPGGNGVKRVYDETNPNRLARGNLLQEFAQPVAGSDADALLTTYTYESEYNLPKTITRAIGNDPSWTPPSGGPNSPGRYATTFTYDYEESLLGDLNGDGLTNQDHGNVIKIVRPTVNPFGLPHSAFTSQFNNQQSLQLLTYNGFGQILTQTDEKGHVTRYRYYPSNGLVEDASDFEGYVKDVTVDAGTGTNPVTGQPRLNLQTNYTVDAVGNLLSEVDGKGTSVSAQVNLNCQATSATGPAARLNAVMTQKPGLQGVLGRMPKDQRIQVNVTYDKNGNPTKITMPSEGVLQTFRIALFTYDSLDNLLTEEVNATRASGLPSSSFPSKLVTKYSYDLNGNVVFVQFPNRNSADPDDSDPLSVESYVYDERDLLHTTTVGGVTAQFASLGANTGIVTTGLVGAPGMSTFTRKHDANGNLISVVDPLGRTTRSLYDGFDRPVGFIDPKGTVTVNLYDPDGQVNLTQTYGAYPSLAPADDPRVPGMVRAVQDVLQSLLNPFLPPCDEIPPEVPPTFAVCNPKFVLMTETKTAYDERGRVYRIDALRFDQTTGLKLEDGPLTPGDGYVTSFIEYDAVGNVLRTVNDNNHATAMVSDGAGRLLRTTDPQGNFVQYEYDRRGNVVKTTGTIIDEALPSNTKTFVAQFAYDAKDRLTQTTTPSGLVVNWAYDSAGLLANETDSTGVGELRFFDNADRIVKEIYRPVPGWSAAAKAAEIHVTYDYDSNSRLRTMTDGSGRATFYTYDSQDRLKRITYADGTFETATYDANGNLIQRTDPVGTVVNHQYDELNRLTGRTISLGTNVTGATSESFGYDALSRLVRSGARTTAGAEHDTQHSYDSLGRAIAERQADQLILRTFDGVGNLVNLTYPSGLIVNRLYDSMERPHQVRDATGLIADYTFFGPSLASKVTFGNGVTRTAQMDSVGRLSEFKYASPAGSTLVGFQYKYDSKDRVLSEHKMHDPGNSETYSYDGIDRLTSFNRGTLNAARTSVVTPTTRPIQAEAWALSKANEWSYANTTTPTGMVSESRTFGALHEVKTRTISGSTVTLKYDLNGNVVDDGAKLYQYDYANRLVTVRNKATGDLVASYAYDALGRRVSKTLPASPTNDSTHYYYDGSDVIEEQSHDVPVRRYILWSGVDSLVAMDNLSPTDGEFLARHYYATSVSGSVVGLTDAQGALVEGYEYEPFGTHWLFLPGPNGVVNFGGDDVMIKNGASSVGNPYTFTAAPLDAETGFHFFRTRYYSSELGGFVSRDSIGIWGDAAGLGNGYAFLGNSPVGGNDPFGMGKCSWRKPWNCATKVVQGTFNAAATLVHAVAKPAKKAGDWIYQHRKAIGKGAVFGLALVGGAAACGLAGILTAGLALAACVAGAAAAGFVANVITQSIDKGLARVNWGEALLDGALDGALAGVTFGLAKPSVMKAIFKAGGMKAGMLRRVFGIRPDQALKGGEDWYKLGRGLFEGKTPTRQAVNRGWWNSGLVVASEGAKGALHNAISHPGSSTGQPYPSSPSPEPRSAGANGGGGPPPGARFAWARQVSSNPHESEQAQKAESLKAERWAALGEPAQGLLKLTEIVKPKATIPNTARTPSLVRSSWVPSSNCKVVVGIHYWVSAYTPAAKEVSQLEYDRAGGMYNPANAETYDYAPC